MNYLRETVQEHSTHEISKGHNVGRQTMFPVVFSVCFGVVGTIYCLLEHEVLRRKWESFFYSGGTCI